MKKFKLALVALAIVLVSVFLFFEIYSATEWWTRVNKELKDFWTGEVQRQIFTADPLFGPEEGRGSLTSFGIIEWTNAQRRQLDMPALRENTKLNNSASLKVDDMFKNQYFMHVSSSGEGVGDLAKNVQYNFILIGENLALGNFASDESLVEAWMASLGHKENILKPEYTEIGVAVKRGEFEDRQMWIAVQHFAKPVSDCPQVEESLRVQISANSAQLEEWSVELKQRRQDINIQPNFSPVYSSKVREHDELVKMYNDLVKEIDNLTLDYNEQIKQFSLCTKN